MRLGIQAERTSSRDGTKEHLRTDGHATAEHRDAKQQLDAEERPGKERERKREREREKERVQIQKRSNGSGPTSTMSKSAQPSVLQRLAVWSNQRHSAAAAVKFTD